ncbi:hypothetical protein EBZ37_00095 [bacterium]|nr:hypothetical protein [bacterium]
MMTDVSLTLAVLAFFIGALHTIAPDHWVPLSLLSWQRGWSSSKTRIASAQLLVIHVLLGMGFALLFSRWTEGLSERDLLVNSLLLVGGITLIRVFRFSRLREAFASGPQSKRGILAAWSLLGPAESIIPVVLRSNQVGSGFLLPCLAYAAGTLIAGTWLVFWGRSLWNRPWILPQGWALMQRSAPVIPILAFLLTGISVWVKVSH